MTKRLLNGVHRLRRPSRTIASLQRALRLRGRLHLGVMRRFELTDAHWEQIVPLLPPQTPRRGWSAQDHRRDLNGMLRFPRIAAPPKEPACVLRPCEDGIGPMYRWRKAGVFDRVLQLTQTCTDIRGDLD